MLLTTQEVYAAIQSGQMTEAEFMDWYCDVRDAAVQDAEYAASAYGV